MLDRKKVPFLLKMRVSGALSSDKQRLDVQMSDGFFLSVYIHCLKFWSVLGTFAMSSPSSDSSSPLSPTDNTGGIYSVEKIVGMRMMDVSLP